MKKKEVKVVNKGIDTTELITAMDELEKTNGINKEFLMQSIESALVVAYKKNFECNDENVKVVLDKNDGQMHVYQEKDVVEEVTNTKKEISLSEAQKINVNYNVGDKVEFELMPKEFGRIAAQTARQVITQKIREASRDVIFSEFADKKGTSFCIRRTTMEETNEKNSQSAAGVELSCDHSGSADRNNGAQNGIRCLSFAVCCAHGYLSKKMRS